MLITHTPRQTHKNAPTSPCNHGKENTRATSADTPQANVGDERAIVEGTHPAKVLSADRPRRPQAEVSRVFRVTFLWRFSGF